MRQSLCHRRYASPRCEGRRRRGTPETKKTRRLPEGDCRRRNRSGLYYNHSPREVQRRVFAQFIRLASEIGLPLVVHERDAASEAVELLRSEGAGKIRGVIHCFTGDYDAARNYLDLGFYLSFTGIVTFKNAQPLRDVVRRVPLDRMFVETDSPYLTPVPYRGKRNEPAYVMLVAETVARVKNMTLEEVAHTTTRNVRRLFRI